MSIETYFHQIGSLIETCPVVQSSKVTYDKRARYEGFIRGEIFFVDGSVLHLREFVDVGDVIDRFTYVYQYMDATQSLVFRYDNTGHHKKLNLPTYPHHKHLGGEDMVVPSSAPSLAEVLDEIMMTVELP
ncbi:MAG: DUF6516 family protein [Anaerolineae bacterium]